MSARAASSEPGTRRGPLHRLWGAGPLHLVGHVAMIAVVAWALSVMFRMEFAPQPWNLVLWLLGGAVLHDAVFLPAYSAVHVAAQRVLQGRGPARVPVLDHLRVPIVIAGVLLLVYAPRIFAGQPQNFERALGHPPPDYLGRWLAVVAGLFVLSAVLYGVRWIRAGRVTPDSSAAADAPAQSQ